MTVDFDLWTEASRDLETEESQARLTRAKVAVASLWPFLALARSEREFDHRLALAADRFDQRVENDLLEPLLASLREDFRVTAASEEDEEEPEGDKDSDDEWQKPWEKDAALAPVQIFHVASGRWITVQADSPATRDNPQGNDAYFEDEAEEGPNTGQTGQYPQHPTGADPADPINSMFPMQPSPWTPNNAWVENPMTFAPYKQASGNPNFFSGGPEGVSGEPQAGFPADVALPEPDERVDQYGTTPPLQSGGTTGDGHPYSNPAVHGSRRPFGEGFFDPKDTSVRVIAVGGPYGSGNKYNSAGSEVGAGRSMAPQPPPSMMPGGPGSEAIPAMNQGAQSTSDMAAKQENPVEPTGDKVARRIAVDVMQRPTTDNPGGVADEYEAKTWDGATTQRPMQPAEHRNVNTPQRPEEPIPQSSSSGMETETEDGQRRASLRLMSTVIADRAMHDLFRRPSQRAGVAA